MQKIYLHIGTFKTGSTALQFHMHRNRSRLLENGFYYGDYFDNYYLHSNICYGLLKEALMMFGCFEQYKNHPRFCNVAEEPEQVIKRIKLHATGYANIIISCEAFFADAFRTLVGLREVISEQKKREINRYMRQRLKELLSDISDDFVIICYLRRQDLFIEAQYNQYLKTTWHSDAGKKLPDFMEFVQWNPIELNYFTVLEEWNDIFSQAVFIIKPYERDMFHVDLVTDFYTKVLKISMDEVEMFEGIDKKQSNLRMDRDVLEYKKELGIINEKINRLLAEYSEQLISIKDYAYFSKSERIQFLSRFQEQNEKTARKYLNRKDGCLFKNTDYDINMYNGLTNTSAFNITRWVMNKLLL